jgi:YcxB-like protein
MQFDYAMTLQDFHEAYTPRVLSKRPQKPTNPLVIWLPLFAFCIFAAYRGWEDGLGPNQPAERNLWLDVIPSIIAVHALLFLRLRTRITRHLAGTRSSLRLHWPDLLWMIPLMYSPAIWLIPVWFQQLSVPWKPSEGQVLWAAAAPWMLYAGIVTYRDQWSKKNVWANIWANHPSLSRSCHFEATDQFFSIDDGEVYRRIQWAAFTRYEETDNLLVLIPKEGFRQTIAKRAIPDENALNELRRLISDHIENGEFLPHKTAFPVIPHVDGD